MTLLTSSQYFKSYLDACETDKRTLRFIWSFLVFFSLRESAKDSVVNGESPRQVALEIWVLQVENLTHFSMVIMTAFPNVTNHLCTPISSV